MAALAGRAPAAPPTGADADADEVADGTSVADGDDVLESELGDLRSD